MVQPGGIIPSCFPAPFLSLLLLLFLLLPQPNIAEFRNEPSSVSVPTVWTPSELNDFKVTQIISSLGIHLNFRFKVVLSRLNAGPSFLCGFMCSKGRGGGCYFHLLIFQPTQDMKNIMPWSVSLIDHEPVNDTSQMRLTQEGDLVLLGDDGRKIWSTNTAGKSVVGLNLTEVGNLVLYDRNDVIVWQSFNHLTDAILPGQELRPGMKLTTTSSAPDGTAWVYTFTIDDQIGFIASVRAANSSQIYYRSYSVSKMKSDGGQVGALYKNGTFVWNEADLLEVLNDCDYPLVCGSYGICSYMSRGSDCGCPDGTVQIERAPSSGCNRSSPFSCDSHNNSFIEIEKITFNALSNDYIGADISNTTTESCKEECLKKGCSCKMALFRNKTTFSSGDCYLLPEPFSLVDDPYGFYSTLALIKVNKSTKTPTPSPIFRRKNKGRIVLILGTTAGAGTMFLEISTSSLGKEDLGTLPSGVRIAVKRLDGFGQIKKSFLAEAGTIGTIHHVNLVRLLGFCAEKSHRLLVYEYMCNGSLDKWIFHNDQEFDVCWQVRRKIILDIAKGLAYLHEECHQKIIHLDIKPQNILLDEHFNAKLADFGLSKLIDKDQSHVITTMRGTPGYLAPEWLSSVITEKVDVYSFGIVMLEVLCGRKNVDRSLPSDEAHLLTLFKCKAEQEQLLEMVDKSGGDMQLHGQEAVKMMKIAAWCLQDDSRKRPPMSQVVKFLEGSADIEDGWICAFSVPSGHRDPSADDATRLLPSQLSGPR
ncbi:hypothetical protein BT93_L0262 [Corymbia citriodora subsp. variegata]|uniref:Receptor-like serine/threonine-protein kinase n=1 Tax=Corymbia citriodora subsp. variegata TaxID=360336 RepID=A0A8T0CUF8_CORYI|nr:hypothetical protein BT93_L0262 [Corymbia citriodora subsp. variegata]